MNLLKIVLSSLISIAVLFILAKLIGHRQMSELSMFDYINGITIGSIAAEMATSLNNDIFKPLIAMLIYGLSATLISKISSKSIKLRRFLNGRSTILFNNNTIYYEELKKCRLDINEFLTQCRISGYFDLEDIKCASMEQNGKISFLPTNKGKTVTLDDLSLKVPEPSIFFNIIIDGKILNKNLAQLGFDRQWLMKKLHEHGIADYQDVSLAYCDCNGLFKLYFKDQTKNNNDIFI